MHGSIEGTLPYVAMRLGYLIDIEIYSTNIGLASFFEAFWHESTSGYYW